MRPRLLLSLLTIAPLVFPSTLLAGEESSKRSTEDPLEEVSEEPPISEFGESGAPLLLPPFALPPEFPASVLLGEPGTEPSIQPPEPADFSLIYEGRTGGVSGAAPDFSIDGLVSSALDAKEGRVWSRHTSGWGAFLQDGRWLLLPNGGVSEFRDVVAKKAAGPPGPTQTVAGLLADDYALFVWPADAAPGLLEELGLALSNLPLRPPPEPQEFEVTPQRSDLGEVLLVERGENTHPLAFPLDPDLWETRLRSRFSVETPVGTAFVQVVSRLEGEGARRVALTEQWRGSPSLYLSAGESVEGRSFLSGEALSLQRPTTWALWKKLGLAALAPGGLELAAGIEGLRTEAAQAGVALVSANLVDNSGLPLYAPYTVKTVAGRRVALIGWTDPSIYSELSQGLRATARIEGVAAVHRALVELGGLNERPDLVVFFGVGANEVAGDLPGIDIVLGNFATDLRLARWEGVGEAALRARSLEHPRARAPALVSRLGGHMLGRVDLAFDAESGALRRLRHLRARIAEEQPVDEDAVRAVQATRQSVYASLSPTLIPALESLPFAETKKGRPAPPTVLNRSVFERLSANLLMDRTGADLALLRPLPDVPAVPGATAELYVDASFSVSDQVVVIELTGAELKAVLRTVRPITPGADPFQGSGLWAWIAGAKVSGTKVTVRGRPLTDAETIRLATSDFFSDDPALAGALKKTRILRGFSGEGWRRASGRFVKGAPWRLHDLVKDGLVLLRDGEPDHGASDARPSQEAYARALRPLLLDQSTERSGRLRLELDGLAIQLTGSLPAGDREDYGTATESRVHQTQAMNASARGRTALVWDDRIGSATAYLEFAFGEQQTPEATEPTELEDDLEVGIEGRLRLISIPTKKSKIGLSSFLQVALDSEFTKNEEAEEVQKTLRFTSGTSFGKYLFFKELKTGFFLEYDTVSDESPVAPGFSIYAKMDKLFGPMKWSAFGDLRGYLPTEKDSLEDLAFSLQLRTDLAVLPLRKFVPGLSIGAFADAFVFQGARPVNVDGSRGELRPPGLHLLVGLAITYDSDVTPPLRLR